MKLYHFCSRHHYRIIKDEGLTLGVIPLVDDNGDPSGLFVQNVQWLTRNPSFTQTWDINTGLDYSRTAFRIEVVIPKSRRDRLYKWLHICRATPELSKAADTLNLFGDPENWYCFMGHVKPKWFRDITEKPDNKKSFIERLRQKSQS